MNTKLSVLVLDDDLVVRSTLKSFLQKDFELFLASTPSVALRILKEEEVDIVISDFQLPEMNGLEFIRLVKEKYPDTEIIMISSHADMDTVIDAMRIGAIDFFKKPFEVDAIKISIERTRKFAELGKNLKVQEDRFIVLQKELLEKTGIDIIGRSSKIQELKEIMRKVAQTPDTSIMITGESGTGKELVARGIHNLSSRKDQYFGAVNTSAISESLFESEFFGHKKGAFTGADENRAGWFEIADKGTLFLDEIGDMAPALQVKLLRVLEDRKYIRVGSQKEQTFDIRVISATNKNIEKLKKGESFRTDLFHRLATFEIHIPPLRERKNDIPLLAEHYLSFFNKKLGKKVKGISDDTLNLLISYDFPGNIREMRNLFERALILCDSDILDKEYFSQIKGETQASSEENLNTFDLEETERLTIIKALERCGYNKSKAAKLLNIQWNALYRRMQKFGIEDIQT
ncbi:MAG: sigma-54 dependent transcriptional regulator [Bacteroidales bacterium]|nr:sigma-54 dependent transcriptional regulator [Bacteroidales bacterium]